MNKQKDVLDKAFKAIRDKQDYIGDLTKDELDELIEYPLFGDCSYTQDSCKECWRNSPCERHGNETFFILYFDVVRDT
jgi:hypothetical protein